MAFEQLNVKYKFRPDGGADVVAVGAPQHGSSVVTFEDAKRRSTLIGKFQASESLREVFCLLRAAARLVKTCNVGEA